MSRLAATTDLDWFTELLVGGQRTVNQLVAEQLDPILRHRGHRYRVREFCQPPAAHVLAVIGAEYGTTADSLGPIVYRLATAPTCVSNPAANHGRSRTRITA